MSKTTLLTTVRLIVFLYWINSSFSYVYNTSFVYLARGVPLLATNSSCSARAYREVFVKRLAASGNVFQARHWTFENYLWERSLPFESAAYIECSTPQHGLELIFANFNDPLYASFFASTHRRRVNKIFT